MKQIEANPSFSPGAELSADQTLLSLAEMGEWTWSQPGFIFETMVDSPVMEETMWNLWRSFAL